MTNEARSAARGPCTEDFWRLTDLGKCVVMQLSIREPQQEGELKISVGYHRSLAPTLRALVRRGAIERAGMWEYALTDAGRVLLGLAPHRPELRVIEGGAA